MVIYSGNYFKATLMLTMGHRLIGTLSDVLDESYITNH